MTIKNNKATVICNKCGKTLDFDSGEQNLHEDIQIIEEEEWDWFHNFCVHAGYPSKYDNHPFNFHLCDDCLEKLVDSFKIDPDKKR